MSIRKMRRAGRDLLWMVGTPQCERQCVDCQDHPARVEIMRRGKRHGSAYAIESKPLLHLCETCATRLVADLAGMLAHMAHNRVDAHLSMTTADHARVARDTGDAARHDRRVRARMRKLAKVKP